MREITTDDWQQMRDIRLTALAEAPAAFGSSYAREAAFTPGQWRGRINERSVTFFAYLDAEASEPAGLAGVFVEDGQPDVVAMWVRPSARGHRVGEALVEAGAAWATARSHPALFLWVTETNDPARRLYARCGFTVTGERQPLPSDTALMEVRMRRAL